MRAVLRQAMENITNAQLALDLLLPQGDFAAALDVLSEMRSALAQDDLSKLHCFRHLPQQISDITQVCFVWPAVACFCLPWLLSENCQKMMACIVWMSGSPL